MDESKLSNDFLDLACLRYMGNDDPGRYRRASEMIGEHPDLGARSPWVAAALADVSRLAEHLDADAGVVTRKGGPRDWVPLLYLCYSRAEWPGGDALSVLQLLLERGADPNSCFSLWNYHFTALSGVMGEGEQGIEATPPHPRARELAECLLDAGADPNDSQGLYNTMFRPDDGWIRLFLSRGLTAEHEIQWDMKVEPTPRMLDFLLSHAVDVGFPERIELLLEHGANPNSTNPYNGRSLHTNARLAGHSRIAERLLQAGADPPELTVAERFQLAILEQDVEEAERLVASDASHLDDFDLLRRTVTRGLFPSLKLLARLGAKMDACDPGGTTLLHHAAFNGHVDVIRFLLEHGADPDRRDTKHDSTPLGWAEYAGQERAAAILRG